MKLKINATKNTVLRYNELSSERLYKAITDTGVTYHCVMVTYLNSIDETVYCLFLFEDMYGYINLDDCVNWRFQLLDDAEITITYKEV